MHLAAHLSAVRDTRTITASKPNVLDSLRLEWYNKNITSRPRDIVIKPFMSFLSLQLCRTNYLETSCLLNPSLGDPYMNRGLTSHTSPGGTCTLENKFENKNNQASPFKVTPAYLSRQLRSTHQLLSCVLSAGWNRKSYRSMQPLDRVSNVRDG